MYALLSEAFENYSDDFVEETLFPIGDRPKDVRLRNPRTQEEGQLESFEDYTPPIPSYGNVPTQRPIIRRRIMPHPHRRRHCGCGGHHELVHLLLVFALLIISFLLGQRSVIVR